ncbi:MAG: DUF669 domain-containing protein [Erysipelotrichaceae bacterium]|nr:DUF669 domain-containing protein [Erysipelotrichaceae bacterium]
MTKKDMNILDWDSTIEEDGQGFVLLDEGDYDFTVTGFERGQHNGSAKIPPCPKALLTLSVETDAGVAEIKENLILYKTMEWKLSSFFRCIGLKKHGERLVMDWGHVLGASGRAHIIQREYVGNDGTTKKTNGVAYFMDYIPAEKHFNPADPEDIPF